MSSLETKLLEKIIKTWINKHESLIEVAQKLCLKINDMGMVRGDSLPFQILPTEMVDADGDVICDLIINMDHPYHGFYSIKIFPETYEIVPPENIKHRINRFGTHEHLYIWLDKLEKNMEPFYELDSMAENKNINFCSLFLTEKIEEYKNNIKLSLEKIKDTINNCENVGIATPHAIIAVHKENTDYTQALIMPSLWVVFKDLNNLPDVGEELEDYVSEDETEKLFVKLNEFFNEEFFYAAPVYFAIKICLMNGLKVESLSRRTSEWCESKLDDEVGTSLYPVLDTDQIRVY